MRCESRRSSAYRGHKRQVGSKMTAKFHDAGQRPGSWSTSTLTNHRVALPDRCAGNLCGPFNHSLAEVVQPPLESTPGATCAGTIPARCTGTGWPVRTPWVRGMMPSHRCWPTFVQLDGHLRHPDDRRGSLSACRNLTFNVAVPLNTDVCPPVSSGPFPGS